MGLVEKCATVIVVIFPVSGVCLSGVAGFCFRVACRENMFPYRLFSINKS